MKSGTYIIGILLCMVEWPNCGELEACFFNRVDRFTATVVYESTFFKVGKCVNVR